MKRGFRRDGMQASGLAIFAVVVLAVVGIVLLEVGAVAGVAAGRGNPEIEEGAVGRVVAAQPMYDDGGHAVAARALAAQTHEAPDDAWSHYMLGLSAWKAGALVQAVASLREAVARDPEHVKSYVNLARVLLEAGRPWEALEAIREAVMRDAAAPGVQRVLGRCYHENGESADAEIAYKQAIGLDARDAWALNNLGLLYIEQQRFEEALYALASASLVRDDIAEVQNNLGVALERTGHPLAATLAYARALEIDGAYEKARFSLTRVQLLAESTADEGVDLAALAGRFRLDSAAEPVVEETPATGPESQLGPATDAGSLSSDVAR